VRVIVLSLVGPVILSALGPFYYGYTDAPYWRVIVWALACTVGSFFWWGGRSAFKTAFSAKGATQSFWASQLWSSQL
jgi:hypothetical protein